MEGKAKEELVQIECDIKVVKTVRKIIKSKSHLGLQAKKRRLQSGFSQDYVSGYLDVSRPTLSNIEGGRHNPSFEILKRMCMLFECTASDLLGF
ncbi:helix-turn-helix transcriptional regulator [Elizabethkingia meningoseptica]|uniref:helix-turn-helix transcriptional regulator n=1 Tax=Elizabethkingia meningoseptica TaxID=238 RepID=UPI0021A7450E|nr:helix-turn-helix transcriptional regulator [Elizabethkingia meningoseptica]EJK5330547.1 helix-turn-helix transcriptional regulator [Elizabethkingia meningoseptica]MCT3817132.1 helix-turn-helix transcriptional regulator [Elizabethkingia anophelis]MCT3874346.1 helix-turn-helix transcriptional regulator [Elizabethkingia anophelis]WBS75671.1 helix-turn-helix transcriptional regulator [Elizabethkingia meningoseptica]